MNLDFWDRLRERKLVQWVLTYCAGAWVVLQVADLVGNQFGWSTTILRSITVLLGVGFLVVLVLAWYHGEKGAQRVAGVELLMLATLLLAAGAAVSWVGGNTASGDEPEAPFVAEQNSIAVLPFVNMSGNADREWFSDGLTEELLNVLAQIPELKVAARTSAFSFKGKNVPVDSIGRVLRVAHVLEGSVRADGDRVRITAQLINASTGYHLWSETYDGEIKDIFALQDEISGAIVQALALRLADGAHGPSAVGRTRSPEAYRLYLQGRHAWNKRTREGLEQAIEFFSRAIDADPEYASAHVSSASAYKLLGNYAYLPTSVSDSLARRSLERALNLNPGLADAHALRGMFLDEIGEWAEAEKAHRRAIQLQPSFATAHHWYATSLMMTGRTEEALRAIRRAQQLDPLAPVLAATEGVALQQAGRHAEAMRKFGEAIELEPGFPWAWFHLALAHAEEGDHLSALQHMRRAMQLEPEHPRLLSGLVAVHARAGRSAEARALLERLRRRPDGHVEEFAMVLGYAALGELDEAFRRLQRVPLRGDPLIYLRSTPTFRALRADPRYPRLLEQSGLYQTSRSGLARF